MFTNVLKRHESHFKNCHASVSSASHMFVKRQVKVKEGMTWRRIKGRVAVKETKEIAYTVLNIKPVRKQQHPVALSCYLLINVQEPI